MTMYNVSIQLHLFSPFLRMAEWVKQQAEREAEKEQKRLERLQRKLAEPKHCFTSPDYQQQCHEMAERLEDSVLKGENEYSSVLSTAPLKPTVAECSTLHTQSLLKLSLGSRPSESLLKALEPLPLKTNNIF